jgi:nucleoside-diphosphate-sugar epimerase
MKKKIAAVTGARGMIGKMVVSELINEGWEVRVLTRSNGHFKGVNVEEFYADLNSENLAEFVRDVDLVFHCAAELHDEKKMYSTNVKGTKNLLNALSKSRVSYFCHLSSAGVVGPTSQKLIDENSPCNPKNLYEVSKYEAELLVSKAKLNMNVCILRPTNVITSLKPGVVALAIRNNLLDKIKIFVKGSENAHIVHAIDVARAALYFMNSESNEVEIFFISQDSDSNNVISRIYDLYRGKCGHYRRWVLSLPTSFPYLLRYILRGKNLHGSAVFLNTKTINAGFSYDYDVDKCVSEICRDRGIEL